MIYLSLFLFWPGGRAIRSNSARNLIIETTFCFAGGQRRDKSRLYRGYVQWLHTFTVRDFLFYPCRIDQGLFYIILHIAFQYDEMVTLIYKKILYTVKRMI